MLLKRHYDSDSLKDWLAERDAEVGKKLDDVVKATGLTESAALKLLNNQYSDAHDLPQITHIEVKHCGKRQNLNQGFIDKGIAEGWLSIGDGKITMQTEDDEDDLVFAVDRVPGHYSCYTGEKLNGEAEAKAHVKQQDDDSPDEAHPAGYEKIAYYECVREATAA